MRTITMALFRKGLQLVFKRANLVKLTVCVLGWYILVYFIELYIHWSNVSRLGEKQTSLSERESGLLFNDHQNKEVVMRKVDFTYSFIESLSTIEKVLNRNSRHVTEHPCSTLFDIKYLHEASSENIRNIKLKMISNHQYRAMTNNCEQFKHIRGYLDSSFTEIERDFPIAYSMVVFRDVERIERLLRALYRPQNYYCIHVDAKTSQDDVDTIKAITACFDNVFVAEQSVNVLWGEFSLLEAELVCMKELYDKAKRWKYLINLTGQEFPLKTNLELVKILTTMDGANIVDGTLIRLQNYPERFEGAGSPPHNIRHVKGAVHVAVNRDFVQFALYDNRSQDFLEWLKKTKIPDESFFSTLNHNPQLRIPGSFLGDAEEYPRKPSFIRYKNWYPPHGVWVRPCGGKFSRAVCILGVGDLHRLKDDISLFANKFHMDFEPIAFACMEELLYNRTRDQYLHRIPIDVSYYSQLDQVRLQVRK